MTDYEDGQFSDADGDDTLPFEVVPARPPSHVDNLLPELVTGGTASQDSLSEEDLDVLEYDDEDSEDDEDLDLNYGDQWFSASKGGYQSVPFHLTLFHIEQSMVRLHQAV